eukprot:gene42654-56701_t
MAKTEKEKSKLIQDPDNDDPFVNYVGHFWGVFETRPYMRARLEVIRALEMLGSELSLSKAVLDIRDCLRLCRGDNIGLRFLAPGIMLRIAGRDQECYDFIKWWITYPDSHYDWGNTDLPYLHIADADMLEPVFSQFLTAKWGPDISFYSAMTLLKIRLLFTVQDVAAFDFFLLGTHCMRSPVHHTSGNYRVLSTIRSFLFVESK